MTSYEMAVLLAKTLDGKKGLDIKVLKTEELTTLADYFVLCTATSNTQIKAMSDACEEEMEKRGERVHHIEGHRGGTWLLMDFSCVVVHVFTDEARKLRPGAPVGRCPGGGFDPGTGGKSVIVRRRALK